MTIVMMLYLFGELFIDSYHHYSYRLWTVWIICEPSEIIYNYGICESEEPTQHLFHTLLTCQVWNRDRPRYEHDRLGTICISQCLGHHGCDWNAMNTKLECKRTMQRNGASQHMVCPKNISFWGTLVQRWFGPHNGAPVHQVNFPIVTPLLLATAGGC